MDSKEWHEWATGKPVADPFPGKTDKDLAVIDTEEHVLVQHKSAKEE